MNVKSRKRYTAEFKAQAVALLETGKPIAEVAELRALRRENLRLQQENDILKKAAVILGTKLPPSFGK